MFHDLGVIGASGASITSTEENTFVRNLAAKYTDESVLLGAEELGQNNFVWMDGSSFSYQDFEGGQPDGTSADQWVGYYKITTNGRWHDLSFNDPQVTHYVAEWSNFETTRLIDSSVMWGFTFDSGFNEVKTGIDFFRYVEGNPLIVNDYLSLANASQSALVSDVALIPSEGQSFAVSIWMRDNGVGTRQAVSQGKMNILGEQEFYIGRYGPACESFTDVTLECMIKSDLITVNGSTWWCLMTVPTCWLRSTSTVN